MEVTASRTNLGGYQLGIPSKFASSHPLAGGFFCAELFACRAIGMQALPLPTNQARQNIQSHVHQDKYLKSCCDISPATENGRTKVAIYGTKGCIKRQLSYTRELGMEPRTNIHRQGK